MNVELVQWIVPAADGALQVAWAPAWADRVPALGRDRKPARRRGPPLVSRWLPFTLGVAVDDDAAHASALGSERRLPLKPGDLALVLGLALDGDARAPLVSAAGDDVRFAGIVAELVRVVADLAEAAGLPAMGLAPLPERRGLELRVGAVGNASSAAVGDALLLLRVAVESCAQARGLQLVDVRVRLGDKSAPVDGRVHGFLEGAAS